MSPPMRFMDICRKLVCYVSLIKGSLKSASYRCIIPEIRWKKSSVSGEGKMLPLDIRIPCVGVS